MKKNNRGFTIVEVLAVIVILGILMVVAVPAVYKYLSKSRNFSYDNMYKSVFSAAQNYHLENNDVFVADEDHAFYDEDFVKNTLVEEQYLEPLLDPASEGNQCSAEVFILLPSSESQEQDSETLEDFYYKVHLKCSAHEGTKTFNSVGDIVDEDAINEGIKDAIKNTTFKMKYDNKNGASYTPGTWTNKNIWIGEFQAGEKYKNVKYQYVSTVNGNCTEGTPKDIDMVNVQSATFQEKQKICVRQVTSKGVEGDWSSPIDLNIDKTAPTIKVTLADASQNYKQLADTVEFNGTNNLKEFGDDKLFVAGDLRLKIEVTDDESGLPEKFHINYNNYGDTSYNEIYTENSSTGDKTYSSGTDNNKKYDSGKILDGYRVVEIIATDNAGNERKIKLKFVAGSKPPTINATVTNGITTCTATSESKDKVVECPGWFNTKVPKVTINATGVVNIENNFHIDYNTPRQSSYVENYSSNSSTGDKKFTSGSSTSKTYNTGEISDGYRIVKITVTNENNNSSVLTLKLKVDTKPPTVSVNYSNNNNGEKIINCSTSSPNSCNYSTLIDYKMKGTYTYSDKDGSWDGSGLKATYTAQYNASGNSDYVDTLTSSGTMEYKETRVTTLSPGYRRIYYTFTDVAGNESHIDAKLNIGKDICIAESSGTNYGQYYAQCQSYIIPRDKWNSCQFYGNKSFTASWNNCPNDDEEFHILPTKIGTKLVSYYHTKYYKLYCVNSDGLIVEHTMPYVCLDGISSCPGQTHMCPNLQNSDYLVIDDSSLDFPNDGDTAVSNAIKDIFNWVTSLF